MGNTLRNISTIAGKELRSYFGSPIAWVTLGMFALLFGYFYNAHLDFFMRQSMQSQFGPPRPSNVNVDMISMLLRNATVVFLFFLPMITMQTYSEEKRSGTIELLLTSPVTDVEIVLGKFIGVVGFFASQLLLTLFYIAILFAAGQPDWRPIAGAYVGLLLMGSCFLAVGVFISSTTKNQMVAGAATFAVLLLFWIINWTADSAGPTMGPILNYLSITQHFDDFGKGVIDTTHVVFYLSFISFGLFLTLKSVDSERWRG